MWRTAAWRGRAGQAFMLREPGVADGITADSLVVDRRSPQQDGQTGKSKLLARSCLRILVQSLRANASPLIDVTDARKPRPSSELCGTSAVISLGPISSPLTCSSLGEASIPCRPRKGVK